MNTTVHPTPALRPSPEDAPAFPEDAVEVGRILGAWGVKGAIRVKPFAADPQALFSCKRWFVRPGSVPRPGEALPPVLRVREARSQGDVIVATCADLDDREAAERLKGARLFVSRASFPTAGEDEFYWVDLIGLRVSSREGIDLGVVSGLLDTGPHCVLCVEPPDADGQEVLIPFVDAYVDRVDLAGRVIHVDWQADY